MKHGKADMKQKKAEMKHGKADMTLLLCHYILHNCFLYCTSVPKLTH